MIITIETINNTMDEILVNFIYKFVGPFCGWIIMNFNYFISWVIIIIILAIVDLFHYYKENNKILTEFIENQNSQNIVLDQKYEKQISILQEEIELIHRLFERINYDMIDNIEIISNKMNDTEEGQHTINNKLEQIFRYIENMKKLIGVHDERLSIIDNNMNSQRDNINTYIEYNKKILRKNISCD